MEVPEIYDGVVEIVSVAREAGLRSKIAVKACLLYTSHLFAMLAAAKQAGVSRARVHILLDGRDVPATSAMTYVDALEAKLAEPVSYTHLDVYKRQLPEISSLILSVWKWRANTAWRF